MRGAVENNFIMMAPGYEEGFGLIKGVAIDQHMLTRNRQDDLEQVIARHPEVLGIGLDESTAIIVRGQQFEITGASKVAIHDGRDVAAERQQRNGKKYFFMAPGERNTEDVESLLRNYVVRSDGKLTWEVLDPDANNIEVVNHNR